MCSIVKKRKKMKKLFFLLLLHGDIIFIQLYYYFFSDLKEKNKKKTFYEDLFFCTSYISVHPNFEFHFAFVINLSNHIHLYISSLSRETKQKKNITNKWNEFLVHRQNRIQFDRQFNVFFFYIFLSLRFFFFSCLLILFFIFVFLNNVHLFLWIVSFFFVCFSHQFIIFFYHYNYFFFKFKKRCSFSRGEKKEITKMKNQAKNMKFDNYFYMCILKMLKMKHDELNVTNQFSFSLLVNKYFFGFLRFLGYFSVCLFAQQCKLTNTR